MVRSVAWTGAARLTAQVVSWLATILVARALSPTDYGLVGMSGILICAIQVMSEFGIGSTIVTLRELSRESISQLHGLAVLVGLLACGISAFLAFPVAWFFNSERVAPVVIASSLGFVISSVRIVPASLLRRDLEFKRLAIIDASAALVQSVAVVTLALLGFGVWALVSGPLLAQAFSTIAVFLQRRVAPTVPRVRQLRDSMTFTRHQLTGQILWYSYSSADFLIGGRILGEKPLGVYYLAWTLSRAVPEKIAGLIVAVAPAYFAFVQHDAAALRRYLLRLTETLALVSLPALVGLALLADAVERLILGPGWAGLAGPLRILALHAAVISVAPLPSRVLTARRDTGFLVAVGTVMTAALIPGFWLGAQWGVTGIALAWLLIEPPCQFVILRRACRSIDLPMSGYFEALWPAVSMTTLMSVAVLAQLHLSREASGVARAVGAVAVGGATYLAAGLALHGQRMQRLLGAVLQRRASGA